jgi:hypothetical protein
MAADLPPDLPAELEPLAFLIGTWRGQGLGGYPTLEKDFEFGQEITFEFYGKPLLAYTSRTWSLDGEERPMGREVGFWRPQPEHQVEVVLAHPTGFVEVYLGTVAFRKIELATDLVARTPSSKEVSAEKRMYGMVGEELMYAMDMAAVGQPLQPHLSARLSRVSPAG